MLSPGPHIGHWSGDMQIFRFTLGFLFLAIAFSLVAQSATTQAPQDAQQGQGLVIELDNEFIRKYENLATITSEHIVGGVSAPHPAKNDGEVHIGGWSQEAGFPGVVEIMNVATTGKAAMRAVKQAKNKTITATGGWRLWGEHPGTGPQLQARGTQPTFPLHGEFPSNPDHVFEIHPVTAVKVDGHDFSTLDAIGATKGFDPHDPEKAFVLGYEKLTCKIIPKGNRTRLITQSLGFNFTEFIIRLGENPVKLEDGHAAICSVFDTDGELLVRNRRMVFIRGTDADDHFESLTKGKRLRVIGIPRISLKLIQWRLDHQDDKDQAGNKLFDVSPLDWHLPYEMIIVSGEPVIGDDN
jgi:hypothetical protein